MFGRRKEPAKDLVVAKFYGVVDAATLHENLVGLVAASVSELPAKTYGLQVNYGRPRSYSTSSLNRTARSFSELEMVHVMAPAGASGVSAVALLAEKISGLYQFCVFAKRTDAARHYAQQTAIATRHLRVLYGYGTVLAGDASPLGEARPRRTWLGVSFRAPEAVHEWKRRLHAEGGLKGLYRFNLIRTALLKDPVLEPAMETLSPDAVTHFPGGLSAVTLSDDELHVIASKCPDLRDYVRT